MILPPRRNLLNFLGNEDSFVWKYYGKGILGRIQAWIFRSRLKVLMRFKRRLRLNPKLILDVGCGPMFISYPLTKNAISEYVGIDIMPADRLRTYRDVMRSLGITKIEVIRASAESTPFKNETFDFVLSLDVLEHLSKPRKAIGEIYRIVKNHSFIAISLPLENLFQRLSRMGFSLMRIMGDPLLKRVKNIPITQTPNYHYVGDIKSYKDMANAIKNGFEEAGVKYAPIGLLKALNINAVHMVRKRRKSFKVPCACTPHGSQTGVAQVRCN